MDRELTAHYLEEPRVNDEPLADCRPLFRRELAPRLSGLHPREAILEVNRWCHERVSYRFNDSPTADPLTVYYRGHGRCGEESVFLVNALRAVGIPARQVYVPRWSHADDNHAWVEALAEGQWHCLGACEPEPELDRGWFVPPARRAMLVRSRLFAPGSHPLHGDFLGEEEGRSTFNQTARYAPTQRWTFTVPYPGARITLHVLNTGAFYPILTLTADERGEASADLGLGDLLVTFAFGEHRGELLCKGLERAEFAIPEGPPCLDPGRICTFRAPLPGPEEAPLSPAQQERRERDLLLCDSRRAQWLSRHWLQVHAPLPWRGQGFTPPLADREVAATRLPNGDQSFVMAPPGTILTPPPGE